jgi:transcriptional regulator with XRE-family HTH domain
MVSLTVSQCRAARALLGWSAADLATAGGFGIVTVKRFEGGHTVSGASLEKMSATLAAAGITFIAAGEPSAAGGDGVRLTTPPS